MAAGNAFSLANMAQAAVEGSRDAASIVKGYQNDGDNQQRMQEFLAGGGDGTEAAGNSAALSVNAKATAKTLLGGGGKTERKKFGSLLKGKLGKKLGRAMGRLNVEHKEKRHVTRRGCVYQFGDGDGSYWDRWMTPARSAKYALPDTGVASQSYVAPMSGYKRDLERRDKARAKKESRDRQVENDMCDAHIEYARQCLGHVLRVKTAVGQGADRVFESDDDGRLAALAAAKAEAEAQQRARRDSLYGGVLSPELLVAAMRSHDGAAAGLDTRNPKSEFYRDYRHYQTHVQSEQRLSRMKRGLTLHHLDPKHNPSSAGAHLGFYDHSARTTPRDGGSQQADGPHRVMLEPLLRTGAQRHTDAMADPNFNMLSDSNAPGAHNTSSAPVLPGTGLPRRSAADAVPGRRDDWMVALHRKKVNPAAAGILGSRIRRDLAPEPLLSMATPLPSTVKPSTAREKDEALEQVLQHNGVDGDGDGDGVHITLEHFGVGDVRGKRLAKSLLALPALASLNVRNNRLTARSLGPLLSTLRVAAEDDDGTTNSRLEELILSENRLGMGGAKAVARLLELNRYVNGVPLVKLGLSGVGLSDVQVETLVHALIDVGKTKRPGDRPPPLRILDVSRNKVASRGGIAFGKLLELPTHACGLAELDLSWNYLRGEGANRVGAALDGDENLKRLNLAFNTFGKSGALALGRALETNDCLEWLDLTQNGVDGAATMVLAYGLSINEALEHLILDGNPVGEAGARAMLRLYANGEEDTTLYMHGCNFTISEGDAEPHDGSGGHDHDPKPGEEDSDDEGDAGPGANINYDTPVPFDEDHGVHAGKPTRAHVEKVAAASFEPNRPTGTYTLDMDDPFERAVGWLILEIANRVPGVELGKLVRIDASGTGDAWKEVAIQRGPTLEDSGGEDDGNPEGGGDEGFDDGPEEDLNVARLPVTVTSTQEPFELPSSGLVNMTVTKTWHKPCPCQGITDRALARMMQVMYGRRDSTAAERTTMLTMACKDMFFTHSQVLTILEQLHNFDERCKATSLLLPVMCDDGRNGLTGDDDGDGDHGDGALTVLRTMGEQAIGSVERYMGSQLFHFESQNPTGRYMLHLGRPTERVLLRKLLEINEFDKQYTRSKKCGHGDTSCYGNWSNFRNGFYANKIVNVEALCRNGIPSRGGLLVDYVSPRRAPKGSEPTDDLDAILAELNFQEEKDVATRDEEYYQAVQRHLHAHQPPKPKPKKSRRQRKKSKGGGQGSPRSPSDTEPEPEVEMERVTVVSEYLIAHHEMRPVDADERQPDGAAGTTGDDGGDGKGAKAKVEADAAAAAAAKAAVKEAEAQAEAEANADLADDAEEEDEKKLSPDHMLLARRKRAHELQKRPVHDELKRLVRKMFRLRRFASHRWFTCAQLIRIVQAIPPQFPTARVAAVQCVFSRLVDLEVFYRVEDAMADPLQLCSQMVQERLGLLNILNPNYVDRDYMLYLFLREHNCVATMLVRLAVDEPGENWCDETYQRIMNKPPIPGWALSDAFMAEVPPEGLLCLSYYSGADQGCRPIWPTRRELFKQFLVGDHGGEPDIDEFDHHDMAFMGPHKPKGVKIGGQLHDKVSALRARNEKLIGARAIFETQSDCWHLF